MKVENNKKSIRRKWCFKLLSLKHGLAVLLSGTVLAVNIVPAAAEVIVPYGNHGAATDAFVDKLEGTDRSEEATAAEGSDMPAEATESEREIEAEETTKPEESNEPEEGIELEESTKSEETTGAEGSSTTGEITEPEESKESETAKEPTESNVSEEIKESGASEKSEEMQSLGGDEMAELEKSDTEEKTSGHVFPENEIEQDKAGEHTANVIFAGGEGTEENPYQVATAEQLDAVRNDMEAYYLQVADIDLSGWNWEPIGYSFPQEEDGDITIKYEIFQGTYDGNGYKISNLTIKQDNWLGNAIGLFGESNGFIENVTIESCNIDLYRNNDNYIGNFCVGGIIGESWNKSWDGVSSEINIRNCSVSGDIKVRNVYTLTIGGITGSGNCGNCTNYAGIHVEGIHYGYNIGGVSCGGITGATNTVGTLIDNCVNYGNIMVLVDSSNLNCGGICGSEGRFDNCRNYGNISGEIIGSNNGGCTSGRPNGCIGGILGASSNFLSQRCINHGDISISVEDVESICAGGIVGFIGDYNTGEFADSFNFGKNITATGGLFSYAGRIAGLVTGGISNCYSIETTLVNGAIPTETGSDTQNGKSLTAAEAEALLSGEPIPHPLPDSFSQDMVVPPDEYWVLVMGETAAPIADANITVDGTTSYTYESGIIKLKANNEKVWITADREGKLPFFNWFTLQGGGAGYIKLPDSVPTLATTIKNVILEEEQKSLLTDRFILYQGDPSALSSYTLTIYSDGSEPDLYQLQQNGTVIEESHENKIYVDLMNRLTVDQDGLAIVLKKDGKVLCKKDINLIFKKEPEEKDGSKLEFGSKCKVSIDGTDIPFFDNTELTFDTMVQLPVRIEIEENKTKIYVGDAYDLMKDGGQIFSYNDFVKKVEKEWRHAQLSSVFNGGSVAGFKVSINFVGYGEGEIDPYTGVVQAKVGVYGKITGKNGITWYTFLGQCLFMQR